MSEIKNLLIKRKNELEKIIKEAERFMKRAPIGSLRISKKNGYDQYYLRNDPKDTHGKYLGKNNKEMIQSLAQKEYTIKVLSAAYEEKKCIEQFINKYHPDKIVNIVTELVSSRRKLLMPYVISDDDYANQWQKQINNRRLDFYEDENEIITEKGERVRSKSEKILADKFNLMNIPYHYEMPLYLDGYGTIHPDFIVLNKKTRKEYYWEHFGLMSDPDYCEKAIKKIEMMQKNGFFQGDKLITTYETQTHSIDMRIVDGLIKRYLI